MCSKYLQIISHLIIKQHIYWTFCYIDMIHSQNCVYSFVVGPILWNGLWNKHYISSFEAQLKTYLHTLAFNWECLFVVWCINVMCYVCPLNFS